MRPSSEKRDFDTRKGVQNPANFFMKYETRPQINRKNVEYLKRVLKQKVAKNRHKIHLWKW